MVPGKRYRSLAWRKNSNGTNTNTRSATSRMNSPSISEVDFRVPEAGSALVSKEMPPKGFAESRHETAESQSSFTPAEFYPQSAVSCQSCTPHYPAMESLAASAAAPQAVIVSAPSRGESASWSPMSSQRGRAHFGSVHSGRPDGPSGQASPNCYPLGASVRDRTQRCRHARDGFRHPACRDIYGCRILGRGFEAGAIIAAAAAAGGCREPECQHRQD